MKKLFSVIILLTLIFALQRVGKTYANFQDLDILTCTLPTGNLKVSYPSGTHGIVGSTSTHVGSDSVYVVSDDKLLQCFCPLEGNGIQTVWKKVSSLNSDEAKLLKNQGYIEIPSGLPWGLEDSSYMAKNSEYSCKTTPTGDSGDGKNDAGSSIVQPETGTNPSLATTGNIITLLSLFALGSIFLLAGFILKRKGY